MTVLPHQVSDKDAEFLEAMGFMQWQIAVILRVPPTIFRSARRNGKTQMNAAILDAIFLPVLRRVNCRRLRASRSLKPRKYRALLRRAA